MKIRKCKKTSRHDEGPGPDHCIDAVGMEAHGSTIDAFYDIVKTVIKLETDRSHALRAAIFACGKGGTVSIPGVYGGFLDKFPLGGAFAKGGTVSIPGVYGGFLDKFPLGGAFAKGLTLTMGQTNVHRLLPRLLEFISQGKIDPSFVISHRASLDNAAEA